MNSESVLDSLTQAQPAQLIFSQQRERLKTQARCDTSRNTQGSILSWHAKNSSFVIDFSMNINFSEL